MAKCNQLTPLTFKGLRCTCSAVLHVLTMDPTLHVWKLSAHLSVFAVFSDRIWCHIDLHAEFYRLTINCLDERYTGIILVLNSICKPCFKWAFFSF